MAYRMVSVGFGCITSAISDDLQLKSFHHHVLYRRRGGRQLICATIGHSDLGG